MKAKLKILLFIPSIILASCSNSSTKTAADSIAADSIAQAQQEEALTMLPDTAYPSVDRMTVQTEIIQESVDGTLNSLKDLYKNAPGVFTFRKTPFRDASFGGKVSGKPREVTIDWEFTTHTEKSHGSWGGGSGWTGQPLYVEWPDSCIAKFKDAGVVNENFGKREIIVGSLTGAVYFLNFDTGKETRKAIEMTNPIKGTISLDPTLNGNLYVGQGIADSRPFGAVTIDLYKHEVVDHFGEDPKAQRHWGAYDSSAIRAGQFLFRPGENGTLYKWSVAPGAVQLHSVMRYTVGGNAPGMEASMAVYRNYGITCDNSGYIVCTNLNTMKPVWMYDNGDDTDSSPVIRIEDGKPYVYVGSEVDKQNVGMARYVKLNVLNGELVWKSEIPARLATVGKKHFDGGYYGSSLPGSGDCEGMMFVNFVYNESGQNGAFMSLDTKTGKTLYTSPLKYYAWSSPVGFMAPGNKMYVFTGDCAGRVYVIDGKSGEILIVKQVGNNFESSPVVVGNSLVVGSRGDKIFKMSIK